MSETAREELRRAAEFLGGAQMAFDMFWRAEIKRGER